MANQDEIELLTAEVKSLRQQLSKMQVVESQRREAQDRYSGILDIAHEGIISINETQQIFVFNHGAETIFGYAADEVLGKPLSILMPSRIADTHQRHMSNFAASSVPTRRMAERTEVYGLRKDGREFPAEASISKLDEDGRQIFTVILRDISDRKQAEAELQRRTEELERSNRELEQFANVASHDLQEPLRMVTGYVKLLARRYQGQLDADADEFIGYAVDGVDRMRALINDILTYSQLGASGQTSESINLDSIVERVMRNLKDSADEFNATVTWDQLPKLTANATQMGQLLQNLLSNAIKFKGEESPAIHIGSQQQKGEWMFSVRDNGIGIDSQHYERIFSLFQRLHGRNDYPGTGVGLAICKRVVELHGGRIWVEFQISKGTTFFFTIPGIQI